MKRLARGNHSRSAFISTQKFVFWPRCFIIYFWECCCFFVALAGIRSPKAWCTIPERTNLSRQIFHSLLPRYRINYIHSTDIPNWIMDFEIFSLSPFQCSPLTLEPVVKMEGGEASMHPFRLLPLLVQLLGNGKLVSLAASHLQSVTREA